MSRLRVGRIKIASQVLMHLLIAHQIFLACGQHNFTHKHTHDVSFWHFVHLFIISLDFCERGQDCADVRIKNNTPNTRVYISSVCCLRVHGMWLLLVYSSMQCLGEGRSIATQTRSHNCRKTWLTACIWCHYLITSNVWPKLLSYCRFWRCCYCCSWWLSSRIFSYAHFIELHVQLDTLSFCLYSFYSYSYAKQSKN